MLIKIESEEDLKKINHLFSDIRFYMGNSVLQGLMGEAYTDNINNPTFAILLVRTYCFMSGNITEIELKELIENKLKGKKLIPSDNIKALIEEIYGHNITKFERYSIKKNPEFDIQKLQNFSQLVPENYIIKKIDQEIATKIKEEKYMNIADDYEKFGVGYCCLYHHEIVGVASSNIIYQDGIEVNIKVSEEHQRKGIATALASNLILECIKENKKISWDAANINSVRLAEKLGFEYDSKYDVYKLETEEN